MFYWPNIPGRGEFVRLVLEAAGLEYRDVGREEGFAGIFESSGMGGASYAHMPFAPPYIKLGELLVFQTVNICAFLGERHGLAPADEQGRRTALGLCLTLEDFVREVHDTHHPISVSAYYEEQKMEALRRADDFRSKRLPMFLNFFERVIQANSSPNGWLVGPAMAYPDLYLFQVYEGLLYAFPNAMKNLFPEIAGITDLANRVRLQEDLAAYLASPRRMNFNQEGIFRRYPEMDPAN